MNVPDRNMAAFDSSKHDFDLEIVIEALDRCHKDGDVLDLTQYLAAYHELCRYGWIESIGVHA